MADIFNKKTRSYIMKSVHSKSNKTTELKLINIFKKHHLKGWRRNFKLVGKPDFVFPNKKIAIFADGCFWHGHNCRNTKPKDNFKFWSRKIIRNKKRDKSVNSQLEIIGWKVFRLWECDIKKDKLPERLVALLS